MAGDVSRRLVAIERHCARRTSAAAIQAKQHAINERMAKVRGMIVDEIIGTGFAVRDDLDRRGWRPTDERYAGSSLMSVWAASMGMDDQTLRLVLRAKRNTV